MSDLLDDLSRIRDFQQRRGSACSVGALLDTIEEKTRDVLIKHLDDATISAAALAKVLERHGHRINSTTIRRHRRRKMGEGCACP